MNKDQKETLQMILDDLERNLDKPYGVTRYELLRLLSWIAEVLLEIDQRFAAAESRLEQKPEQKIE